LCLLALPQNYMPLARSPARRLALPHVGTVRVGNLVSGAAHLIAEPVAVRLYGPVLLVDLLVQHLLLELDLLLLGKAVRERRCCALTLLLLGSLHSGSRLHDLQLCFSHRTTALTVELAPSDLAGV